MTERTRQLKNQLSPEWLRDCVMYDKNHNAIVVSPRHCLDHGVTNLVVAQGLFCARSIFKMRLDYDIVKIKKGEPLE